MQRREFIAGLGSATAWPTVARAQRGERVRRIGALFPLAENDPVQQSWVKALDDGSYRLQRDTMYHRSFRFPCLSEMAVCFLTEPISEISFVEQPLTSTAFSAAQNRWTSRFNCRSNS